MACSGLRLGFLIISCLIASRWLLRLCFFAAEARGERPQRSPSNYQGEIDGAVRAWSRLPSRNTGVWRGVTLERSPVGALLLPARSLREK